MSSTIERGSEGHRPKRDAAALTTRVWSEAEFANARLPWDRLVRRAGVDPLFMGWNWQHLWWETHKDQMSGAQLRLLAVYSGDGELVGVAPLFSYRSKYLRFLPVTRLCVIGQAWRDPSVTYSEYLDFLVDPDHFAEVVRTLVMTIASWSDWHELTCTATRSGSVFEGISTSDFDRRWDVRRVDESTAYALSLPSTFDQFLANLGGEVRRKTFNKRKKIADLSFVRIGTPEIPSTMKLLAELRAKRWGSGESIAGPDPSQVFHLKFAEEMDSLGSLWLSQLRSSEKTLSIMYCIRLGEREYFLQSAYSPDVPPSLSLGYIHMGLCIEAACKDGLRTFDFLSGRGKNRDYKTDFGAAPEHLVCLQIIRGRIHRLLYRLHNILRS